MALVSVEESAELRASPDQVWSVIADTDRLNRAVGLAPLELERIDNESAARYLVKTISAGFPLQYEERPFEWVRGRWFSVRRVVRKGAVRTIENRYALEPLPNGGTRLVIGLHIEPRFALLAPIVRLQSRSVLRRMLKAIAALDPQLANGRRVTLPARSSVPEQDALSRAGAELLARLPEPDRALGRALVEFLSKAPDAEVDRIRPFELADQLEQDRVAVLRCCLHAVLAGLLELRWDVICPSCHTAATRTSRLSDLTTDGSCQLCEIRFEVELDRAVEATFRPVPSVRRLPEGAYCIGGPTRTPHVVIQALLPPHGEIELLAPSEPDRYRVFVRGGATAELEVVAGATAGSALRIAGDAIEPARLAVAPEAVLHVHHGQARERHLKIERRTELERSASARLLGTLPEFRRMFGSELLRPGVSLQVGRIAFVFTDLTASTELYARIGDARAFRLVHDHFDCLVRVIEAHGGALVKTIGDAVMAVFEQDQSALATAIAMHREFAALRPVNADAQQTSLKIGVYSGPCYAVTASGVLDYFGQSVNVAARLQGQAGPGEVVMTEALATQALALGLLPADTGIARFQPSLKGVAESIACARVKIDLAAG
jgi:class 3 adenylate cyclase